jgi:predicted ATP-dependent endonuclease of OLD family
MKIIKSIRIKYFRSIHNTTRGSSVSINLDHLNVFVGQNDAGKSNVLRALNLFFNNESEPGEWFNFWKEFSTQRIGKKRETSRIEIELIIQPPLKQSLKNEGDIKWSKTWYPESNLPKEQIQYVNGKTFKATGKSGIYKWLKKIKYRYVPAIKSKEYFNRLMFDLYELFENDTNELEGLFNQQIKEKTTHISEELSSILNMKSVLQFKGTFRELFNMLEFGSEDGRTMLSSRGDGIKISHIPVVLQNMAEAELIENKNREPAASTIIAFEEPENNLEFKFEKKLAETFKNYTERIHYRNNATHTLDEGVQIFITTHSPVFYTLNDQVKVNCFYVGKKDDQSSDIRPIPKDSKGREEVEKEMDLMPLIELSLSWRKLNEKNKLIEKNFDELKASYVSLSKPIVITEGKTDAFILKTAWSKLYPELEMPFDVISGNTHDETTSEIVSAGASVLQHFIKSVRPSDKITIALWDNDRDGLACFKLDKNFDVHSTKNYLKIHKNKKAYGMVLPPSSDRIVYADVENLAIEFYFDDVEIERKNVSGFGITLKNKTIKQPFGRITKEIPLEDPELREIHGSKTVFAFEIVPTLPTTSFWRFKELFETINEFINQVESR